MPIQTTEGMLPEITINPDGKEATKTDIETIDPQGYRVSQEELAELRKEKPAVPPTTPGEPKSPDEVELPKSNAEARKFFLEAQKQKRKVDAELKAAQAKIARADALEKAVALAASGEDPTAVLKAAGLDPVKFYRDMTAHALKEPEKAEDPVQKELREHRERLEQYKKANEELAKSIQDKEDLQQHNAIITSSVIPILNNNPDKYEALLAEYGTNAATEIYKAVYDTYQAEDQTDFNKFRDAAKQNNRTIFEEMADAMETYWTQQIESGLNAALKLKKFSGKFAQNQEAVRNSTEQLEIPLRSKTLSNNNSIQTSVQQRQEPLFNSGYSLKMQKEARIMKKQFP